MTLPTLSSPTPPDLKEGRATVTADKEPAPIVAARLKPPERDSFHALARASKKKPGAYLSELIRSHIAGAISHPAPPDRLDKIKNPGNADLVRVEFRVPVFLKEEIAKRAELESMKSAQWLAALVQSNLMTTPVLTDKEIEVVSWANRELAAVGRNLNQIARSMNAAELIGKNLSPDEQLTLEGVHQVDGKIRKLRDMLLRLVAARHRAWSVSDDAAS